MKRREFLVASAITSVGLSAEPLSAGDVPHAKASRAEGRKILIAGGGFGTAFIRYMAALTGKERPRLCYLPTASADRGRASSDGTRTARLWT